MFYIRFGADGGAKNGGQKMANEKRLIDAEALKHRIGDLHFLNYGMALIAVCEAPTVDAVEVVHGRWKFLDIDGWWFDECSICGNTTPNCDGSPPDWNYCPNCGAKMDGGNEDGG